MASSTGTTGTGSPVINVTAGVIERDGRVLIARRRPDSAWGGKWEFPGGKQEPGETLPQCLRRELLEELGVQVQVGRRLMSVPLDRGPDRLVLHAFWCRLAEGRPRTIGVDQVAWVRPADLTAYDLIEADRAIARRLMDGEE
ncbi:MAG: (deoxy)nucleoside triphosphate pyrophosphohydrolase [Proteobacteria bacterium]|nr:(deoxy)nucleoside triphosphate pyrophosphohydrolase [Pseudomonadota bacterium]